MRLITLESLKSIKKRGYIVCYNENFEEKYLNIQKKLEIQKINPEPYIILFSGLTEMNKKQIIRFICLKWYHVANQLNDIQLENFQKINFIELCNFFLDIKDQNENHRVYFFIEMIYQYFFP